MKTIFTINCEKSDSIGFIVGKLEKLVINNIWNVRINLKGFGLADMERANRMVDALKIVEDKYQQSFNLFIDIPYPGNKCRIKTDEEVQQVGANEIFELCTLGSEMTGRYRRIQVSKSFFEDFSGSSEDTIYFGDGEGAFKIVQKISSHMWIIQSENQFELLNNKSITGANEKKELNTVQIEFLKFLKIKCHVAGVFLSFSESSSELIRFKNIFKLDEKRFPVYAKIETQLGVDNIEDIINVCDGVMVARGDLALYSTMNRYFFNKSKIVDCAREENKRLFIATDILSSLEHKNFPNRADLCDLHHIVEKKPYGIILKSDFFYYNRSEYALKWISCIR